MISIDPKMQERYPGTHFGVIAFRGFQPTRHGHAAFRSYAEKELKRIRQQNADYERKHFSQEDPVVSPYVRYYKKFRKSYHVLHQIESILGGKEIPDTLPLVQVLFLTEIQTSLLIAGHDLEQSMLPYVITHAEGGEAYTGVGGRSVVLKTNDISMRDQAGFILSIIYGQDQRTRITRQTTDILYLIDGVPGIEKAHYENGLDILLANMRIFHPGIEPELVDVLTV